MTRYSQRVAAELVYTDTYGEVTKPQLRAYRKHNVSRSDHDELCEIFGYNSSDRIVKAVTDPAYQLDGSGPCFSVYKVIEAERKGEIG